MLIKRINRSGQISIPKQFQRQLNIQDGAFLYIYNHKSVIVMEKVETQNEVRPLNQCILSTGRVSIPAELRRILQINLGSPLILESSSSDNKIYLKKYYKLLTSKEA